MGTICVAYRHQITPVAASAAGIGVSHTRRSGFRAGALCSRHAGAKVPSAATELRRAGSHFHRHPTTAHPPNRVLRGTLSCKFHARCGAEGLGAEPLCCGVDTFSIGRFKSAKPATTRPHLKVGAQKWTAQATDVRCQLFRRVSSGSRVLWAKCRRG